MFYWQFEPIVGLQLRDDESTEIDLIFEDAGIASARQIEALLRNNDKLEQEKIGMLIGKILDGDSSNTYIAARVEKSTIDEARNHLEDRTLEISIALTLASLTYTSFIHPICRVRDARTEYFNQTVVSETGGFSDYQRHEQTGHATVIHDKPVIMDSQEIQEWITREPYGSLTSLLTRPSSERDTDITNTLRRSSKALYRSVFETTPESQVLWAVTAIDSALVPEIRGDFSLVINRIKLLLGDDIDITFGLRPIFEIRHRVIHQALDSIDPTAAKYAIMLGSFTLFETARIATNFQSHREFAAFCNYYSRASSTSVDNEIKQYSSWEQQLIKDSGKPDLELLQTIKLALDSNKTTKLSFQDICNHIGFTSLSHILTSCPFTDDQLVYLDNFIKLREDLGKAGLSIQEVSSAWSNIGLRQQAPDMILFDLAFSYHDYYGPTYTQESDEQRRVRYAAYVNILAQLNNLTLEIAFDRFRSTVLSTTQTFSSFDDLSQFSSNNIKAIDKEKKSYLNSLRQRLGLWLEYSWYIDHYLKFSKDPNHLIAGSNSKGLANIYDLLARIRLSAEYSRRSANSIIANVYRLCIDFPGMPSESTLCNINSQPQHNAKIEESVSGLRNKLISPKYYI